MILNVNQYNVAAKMSVFFFLENLIESSYWFFTMIIKKMPPETTFEL